ncbi:hypothetical protein E2I00_007443, partial [Balaenoptera physalus]
PAAGGSDDWAYDQGIKYSFTFELRDKGRYGFALPESQIRPTCEETMLAIKYITGYVLDHLQATRGLGQAKKNREVHPASGLIAITLANAPVRFDREKVLRVKPQDEKQANIIKDLAKTNQEFQSIQAALDQNKMHYEILIHDVQEEAEKQFDVKEDIPGRHSYAKYNNRDKIVAWTEKMVHKHPKMVSRIKIGTTVEDNPLYVLKIGEKDERRKAIFMDCGIHAQEWISPAFCQWFVYQATKTYGKNKIMTKLLDRMNFLCSSCYCRTACGEKIVPRTNVPNALELTSTGTLMSQGTLSLTPRTHVGRSIGALHQSPRKRPKLSLTSFEATENQSRLTLPSIPTPRCYCFPVDIHQNCHLTMRN